MENIKLVEVAQIVAAMREFLPLNTVSVADALNFTASREKKDEGEVYEFIYHSGVVGSIKITISVTADNATRVEWETMGVINVAKILEDINSARLLKL